MTERPDFSEWKKNSSFYFQRFFFAKSFIACDMQTAAKASIWLASKIEEDVRRPRDVINVFHFLQQQRDGKNTDPIPLDQGKGY